jgi:subtilisin-like proprotein convertase family protein
VSLAVPEDATILSGGPNGVADPGETVTFQLEVVNEGTLGAESVYGELSSTTPGVVIVQGLSKYPDLPAGVGGTNQTPFSISIPSDHPCGDPVTLGLYVTYSDGSAQAATLGAQMGTGVPQGASVSVSPGLAIPDNNPTGVQSTITVAGTGATVTANLNIDINITHTYIGDLMVRLTSPAGTSVLLHNRTGGSANDIIGNYPGTLTPAQPLSAFIGDPLDGDWILRVSDHAGIDTGTLNSWGLNDVSGYDCETATTDVALATGAPAVFELAAAEPNPFDSSTSIRFAVPGDGARVSLRIYDVAGRQVRTLTDGFVPAGRHTALWDGRSDAGARVGSGIYFYRLEGEGFRSTRKVIHLN